MTGTHGIFDHILFALLLVFPLIEWRWTWPRYLAKLAAGSPGARLRYLGGTILAEWAPTLCLLGFWATSGRSWAGLLLGDARPLRLSLGLAFAALLAGVLWLQRRQMLARPETVERVRQKMAYVEPLLPHTQRERKVFWLVCATAGLCEEIFYRGFLTWYIALWTGPVAAVILSALIFGFGHIYQGYAYMPRTALVGLAFAVVALASGSLWPAILLHAALDWNSGELAFRILGGGHGPDLNS